MIKKISLIFAFVIFGLISCSTSETQNLDINVSGKVTGQNNEGLEAVTIHIQRGKIGQFAATSFNNYQTTTTDESGNYKYVVKNDTYVYRICCEIPDGYTIVGQSCKEVDHTIQNSQTIPNVINFKFEVNELP